MTAEPILRGFIYRCPVCRAEILTLRPARGSFAPRCCNRPMVQVKRRAVFFRCPICGAEIAILKPGASGFDPRCCNAAMRRVAA